MRKALGKRMRFEIFKRDSFTCQYCGRKPPEVMLHVDHILAVANGGGNAEDNLLTSCADCNLGKSAVPMERIKAPINFSAEDKQEKIDQLEAYRAFLQSERNLMDTCKNDVCNRWATFEGKDPDAEEWMLPAQLGPAVVKFLNRLPFEKVLEAVDSAFSKFPDLCREHARFKYFCGTCWKMIRDREQPETTPKPCT
jgi:hypothetical protein